jgi:hypothetical protein
MGSPAKVYRWGGCLMELLHVGSASAVINSSIEDTWFNVRKKREVHFEENERDS